MGKCLVSKLAGEVSNPNLPYFGELIYSGKLTSETFLLFRSEIIDPCKEGDKFYIKMKCDRNVQPPVGSKIYLKDSSGIVSNLADYDIATFEKFDEWNDVLVTATKTTADNGQLRIMVYIEGGMNQERTFDCECYKLL